MLALTKRGIIVLLTVEHVIWPHLTRKAGNHFWKQCGPAALELRGEQAVLPLIS